MARAEGIEPPAYSSQSWRSASDLQRQNTSFPSWLRGFDSRHLLHDRLGMAIPFLPEAADMAAARDIRWQFIRVYYTGKIWLIHLVQKHLRPFARLLQTWYLSPARMGFPHIAQCTVFFSVAFGIFIPFTSKSVSMR